MDKVADSLLQEHNHGNGKGKEKARVIKPTGMSEQGVNTSWPSLEAFGQATNHDMMLATPKYVGNPQ